MRFPARRVPVLLLALGALAGGALVPPPAAAAVVSRQLEVSFEAGGAQLRQEKILVDLEDPADVERWRFHGVGLDDFDELLSWDAEILDGAGKVVEKLRRRDLQRVESPGGDLYNSTEVVFLPFEGTEPGQRLRISTTTRHEPPFPASVIFLEREDEQLKLEVRVEGTEGLRWSVQGPEGLYRTETPDGGLTLRGEGIPGYEAVEWAPRSPHHLLLAWGDGKDWPAVASWFEDLRAQLPAPEASLGALARELTQGLTTPREKVEALAAYVKQKVRYEAVQIGVGGWRPSPASETLNRGWGDCKDKTELLLALAKEVGVDGRMVLVRAGWGQPVVQEFPSPFQFNHVIAALPAEAAGAGPGDPVADGHLFIDATVNRGGVEWLSPFSGARPVLLVDGDRSRFVDAPAAPEHEVRSLALRGSVDETGRLAGEVAYRLKGNRAVSWIRDLQAASQDRTVEDFQHVLHSVAPGARLSDPRWQEEEGAVPAIKFQGAFQRNRLLRGSTGSQWLRLGSLEPLPPPSVLEDRQEPVALSLGRTATEWSIELPPGACPPEPVSESVDNGVGSFEGSVSTTEDEATGRLTLHVRRAVEVRQTLVEASELEPLKELSDAEFQLRKRRIRLSCEEEVAALEPGVAPGAQSPGLAKEAL